MKAPNQHTWWYFTRQRFKGHAMARWAWYALIGLTILAILSPLIANERPLYLHYKGQHLFPALTFKHEYRLTDPATGQEERLQVDLADWKRLDAASVWWAPIPYSPGKTDRLNGFLNADYAAPSGPQQFRDGAGKTGPLPNRFRHWLGTTKQGEDVLAGLLHGTRISLLIGWLSMLVAGTVGLLLGALAGFFGDHRLTVQRGAFWSAVPGLPLGYFYGFHVRHYALAEALDSSGWLFAGQLVLSVVIAVGMVALLGTLGRWCSRGAFLGRLVTIPVDSAVMRSIEILNAVPRLIIIVSLAAVLNEKSLTSLILIIGLTSWTGIARFTRAEFLKVREMDYIQAARTLGLREFRIMLRHALPNGIAPALVVLAFGVAGAILTESGLSFLGIGVPDDVVTWGKMLSEGRTYFRAWWLVIFPGLAIFLTVMVFNLIGEGLREALDPKSDPQQSN